MESRQVHSGLRYQRLQAGNEVQRLEDGMDSAIITGFFQLIADVTVCC